jgi:hypothetical protein
VTLAAKKEAENEEKMNSRGRIFIRVRPFYERAVSSLEFNQHVKRAF